MRFIGWDLGLRDVGLGFREKCPRFEVESLEFWFKGSRFGVPGLGFRV